ncbi:TEA domain-containing protein [Mycena venus]|uniref:TEA domain-containing protein n=1 Tax=Mycena venus TaxID=2733690 RepID=A0A8H6X6F1_9AGAR|nr:TEA domain-containing protein [Mycena venus]
MYWNNDRESAEETASTGSSTPPTPSADRSYAPINGNAWPSLQSQTTKDVLQSVLKVRKSWKTLRGGETVWPLDLEAALLEGKRRARGGLRNKSAAVFSSYESHAAGKKLLHLLSPFRQPAYSDSSASSDSSCTSPVSPLSGPSAPSARHTVVYIDILPEADRTADADGKAGPMWSDTEDVVHASDRPRHLNSINPTVTFMSQSPVIAESRFTVYSEDRVLHAETTQLTPVNDAPVPGFLYSTTLVPEYWRVISESSDPTRFTIYQEVVKNDNSTMVFSATYKFSYPTRHSSGFTVPLDTLDSSNTRSDIDSLISAASIEQNQFHGGRYPLYVTPEWSPSLHSRENSPTQGYRSPSSDSSTCFPSDLSNYVL